MDSYTNIQSSASRRPIRPLARFRVIARHHDHSQLGHHDDGEFHRQHLAQAW
ncbi:MAG: hypothetical protein ABSF26_14205 [Thermoguttaceae bacterium]